MDESTHPLLDRADTSCMESREVARGEPRIEEPQRMQGEMRFEVSDDLVSGEHEARLLWNVLGILNLKAFSAQSDSVEGKAGRSLKSPRMLLTLWVYGIARGIGSAREIARLTKSEDAFRWIVGNVEVSHHKLSQFRVGHGEALNTLMTDVLASLMDKGLLSLDLVSQDGTRTRAAASAPSFRSYGSLLECRAQGSAHKLTLPNVTVNLV